MKVIDSIREWLNPKPIAVPLETRHWAGQRGEVPPSLIKAKVGDEVDTPHPALIVRSLGRSAFYQIMEDGVVTWVGDSAEFCSLIRGAAQHSRLPSDDEAAA